MGNLLTQEIKEDIKVENKPIDTQEYESTLYVEKLVISENEVKDISPPQTQDGYSSF